MHTQQGMSGIDPVCRRSSCVTSTCSILDGNNCLLLVCLVLAYMSHARRVWAQDGGVHVADWRAQTHGGSATPRSMRRMRASYLEHSRWVTLLTKSASSHRAHSPISPFIRFGAAVRPPSPATWAKGTPLEEVFSADYASCSLRRDTTRLNRTTNPSTVTQCKPYSRRL
jgi:hypothetical protein